MMCRKPVFPVLVLTLWVLCAGAAKAALLAYEGFGYTAGTTIGAQNGGSLWTNAWAGGGAGNLLATNNATSLSYLDASGHLLQTSGGSLVVGNPNGPSATLATPNRALNNNLSGGAGTTAGPGGTVWISFLFKRLNLEAGGAPFFRQANLGLFEAGGERLAIGGPNTSATVSNVFSVWGNGATHSGPAPFQSPADPLIPGTTSFILIRVITDNLTAVDAAYVWFNWTNLNVEPDTSTADIVDGELNLSSVNTFRFQAGNQNASGTNASFQVDELRVGTAFADVTPNSAGPAAPTIAVDPQNVSVPAGQPASFTVTANGDAPLSYQWYFNTNTLLSDATNALYTIPITTPGNAGGYFVIVTNNVGSATSAVATLTVQTPILPGIVTQPQNFTNLVGLTATFSITATGSPPLRYQWYFNTNTPVANQTNATLTFVIASTNDAGSYFAIVTNNYGAATSSVVQLTALVASPALLPAFPGADGAARTVTGGRGGIVYHVTKLDRNFNHSEAGTLRYGLTDGNFPPGVPRTIVFDVGGVFWLGRYGAESNYDNGWNAGQSRYNLSGNTTIAGQTAPGPVIIMGGVTKAGSGNTIIRNVMFAPGYGMQGFHEPPTPPTPGDFPDSYVYDALDISGHDIMMDHLTTMYITDEAISCNELAYNLTVQNCNISQGQNYPQADAESSSVSYTGHALAHLLQAGSNARISILNNLYAHDKGRLPRVGSEIGTGALNDFRNNLFYNWDGSAGGGAAGQPSYNNFINNFYLAGPGGDGPVGGSNSNIVFHSGGTTIFGGSSVTYVFASGNLIDVNKDGDPNDTSSADGSYSSIVPLGAALDVNIGLTLSAKDAFTNILHHVGSRWWERPYDFVLGNTGDIATNDIGSYVNERLIHETVTGTGKIIAWADDPFNDDPNEGVEWRSLIALRADTTTFAAPYNRPAGWDTDGDGMPDAWEIEHGLDPNVANPNGDFDNDFYTDLEEYLNDVAAWPAPGVIQFTANASTRYAEIFNWQVNGQPVNVSGLGTVTTFSLWQPSAHDSVLVSNRTVIVDAVGQHAGVLRLTNNATLNFTNGWLKVANRLEIGSGCTVGGIRSGALNVGSNLVNNGTLRLIGSAALTVGGTLTNNGILDIMTWNGVLPVGLVNNGTILDRSLIQITSAAPAGTNFTVTLQGYTGHTYRLQYRDDLASGSWQNIGTLANGNNSPLLLTHSGGAVANQRFYRVVVDP